MLGRVYLPQVAGESLATLGLIDLGYAYGCTTCYAIVRHLMTPRAKQPCLHL
jgi:hypothetical protein